MQCVVHPLPPPFPHPTPSRPPRTTLRSPNEDPSSIIGVFMTTRHNPPKQTSLLKPNWYHRSRPFVCVLGAPSASFQLVLVDIVKNRKYVKAGGSKRLHCAFARLRAARASSETPCEAFRLRDRHRAVEIGVFRFVNEKGSNHTLLPTPVEAAHPYVPKLSRLRNSLPSQDVCYDRGAPPHVFVSKVPPLGSLRPLPKDRLD